MACRCCKHLFNQLHLNTGPLMSLRTIHLLVSFIFAGPHSLIPLLVDVPCHNWKWCWGTLCVEVRRLQIPLILCHMSTQLFTRVLEESKYFSNLSFYTYIYTCVCARVCVGVYVFSLAFSRIIVRPEPTILFLYLSTLHFLPSSVPLFSLPYSSFLSAFIEAYCAPAWPILKWH